MSPSQMRARLSFVAIGAGVMALMLGMMSVWQDSQREARPDVSGQVLPQWSEQARQAERLELRTRDQHIVLTRTEEGQWVMPSRGGYPVLSSVMGELDEFLTGLQYRAALTQDPEKYQRLGLVPPQDGGAGLNLILRDQKDEALVNVILGTGDNNDGLYLRSANSRQTFRVAGTLPEGLERPDRWLGLDFLNLDPGRIARTRISPEEGPEYFLMKPGQGSRNFVLREPRGWRLITSGAANGPAVSSTRLRFRDVRALENFSDHTPVAHHHAVTFDGLSLDFDFYEDGETRWLTVTADGRSDDAAGTAMLINRRAQGWAFLVSEDAYDRLARPLSDMADFRPTPQPAQDTPQE